MFSYLIEDVLNIVENCYCNLILCLNTQKFLALYVAEFDISFGHYVTIYLRSLKIFKLHRPLLETYEIIVT